MIASVLVGVGDGVYECESLIILLMPPSVDTNISEIQKTMN
jgi:hypothetical protein